ncbi:sigma-54-dependent transcriptional regulator [Gluconacetobacter tumulisoli]|uniref:Sigma-54-dependent Fis family transcriptional regulator n=1 Tax=Gluconacetobacter tumulisoli TaxID=1286189 RepID=A0A7W4K5I7_9PROT|nr:response regulator [Gluconacetobacter tumulisoli]MBB2200627.1 sigma-54-dependent Fis family transcriptional regulator [Gluconacetobacter tumulisoli]
MPDQPSSPIVAPSASPPCILFVDDDSDIRQATSLLLRRRGFEVVGAADPAQALAVLAAMPVAAVLLDLNYARGATTGAEGLECLRALLAHDPGLPVVVVTGHSGVAIAVAAMRAGAADFVMKPWRNDRLVATLEDALATHRRRMAVRAAAPDAAGLVEDDVMVAGCAATRDALDRADRVAATQAGVLLRGEAGTGKTALARRIHRLSAQRGGCLLVLDAHGAGDDPRALAARLDGMGGQDTILAEDIGAWPPAAQRALLAWLEDGHRARLLATSRDGPEHLRAHVAPGLLYRLGTVEIALAPLRARGEEIPVLCRHFLRLFARRHGLPERWLAPEAEGLLAARPWPDNVRELRHVLERATVMATGDLLTDADFAPAGMPAGADDAPAGHDRTLAGSEKAMIEAALRRHGFNVSHAARELGLTRPALYRRMARYGL